MNRADRQTTEGRTDTLAQGCPFGPPPCREAGRHKHPYTVQTYGARRCSCGSRRYVVVTGGPLPAKVQCERCGKENYSATCYEAGRAHGQRRPGGSDGKPPF